MSLKLLSYNLYLMPSLNWPQLLSLHFRAHGLHLSLCAEITEAQVPGACVPQQEQPRR